MTISEMMDDAVRNGIFPGGVVLWGTPQHIREEVAAGMTRTDDPAAPSVTSGTLFDLASLTKPLATASIALSLAHEGTLDLEAPLGEYLPPARKTRLENVPFHRLLSHSSGLAGWAPLYRDCPAGSSPREFLLEAILAHPLAYPPGTRSEYSDFGYILAGWILESLGKDRLDRLFDKNIRHPLDVRDVGFNPAAPDSPLSGRVFAATEPPEEGEPPLSGVVHDEHARLLGGIAGHAGLFATARAVWELARPWAGEGDLFPGGWLDRFRTRQEGTPWTLGWDTPTPGSSSGRLFSPFSIGHLGYTGTSLWIDLDRRIIIILLTHRVHPTRTNNRIRDFRPIIHDRIMEEAISRLP
uniref:Class A beta-lactamase-related serine hydrolase n=1 Tax=Leptospirillum ferriphilum TaxID=178606 RepID=A0A7C3QWW7_9BACT